MTKEDTLLDLAEMVEKIDTAGLISTMIDEYRQFLEENRQLELEALLPLMGNRKDVVNREYHELNTEIMRCLKFLVDAMKGNEELYAALSALIAIISNCDLDKKIISPLREVFEEAKDTSRNLDDMCKGFIAYKITASDYNVHVANEIHQMANDFLSKNLFDEEYIFNQIAIIIGHLSHYLEVLSASSRKQKTSSAIRQVLGLRGQVNMCIKQVIKSLEIKTTNLPEINAVVTSIEEKDKGPMKVMSALINSLYLCQEKEARVGESVSIYKLFYEKGKKALATKLEKQKIR